MINKTFRSKALFARARNLYYRTVKEKKQAFYKAKFQNYKCDITVKVRGASSTSFLENDTILLALLY